MKLKKIGGNIVFLAVTLAICLFALELGVRLFGTTNADGNFIILGRALRPYNVPEKVFRENTVKFSRSNHTRFIYHSGLGWTPRPGVISKNGLYRYDSMGIRIHRDAHHETTEKKADGLRIILLGDSYVHGDEVTFPGTIGAHLETILADKGFNVEVVNLAVGGYGIDQALLRWEDIGRELQPDIVLLGLQFENIIRNVNIIRSLYLPHSGLPFTKPRFIFDNDTLRVVNRPCLAPEKTASLLSEGLEHWPLRRHEHFYRHKLYEQSLLPRSRLVGLVQELIFPIETDRYFYDPSREPALVTLKMIEHYSSLIQKSDSLFYIVHIPTIIDVFKNRLKLPLDYARLFEMINERQHIIPVLPALTEQTRTLSFSQLYEKGGHYSSIGNNTIAQQVAEYLVPILSQDNR